MVMEELTEHVCIICNQTKTEESPLSRNSCARNVNPKSFIPMRKMPNIIFIRQLKQIAMPKNA